MFITNENCSVQDKEFIISIYNSDYAAFLINKRKAKRAEGLYDEANKYFEAAKTTYKEQDRYKKAKQHKEKIYNLLGKIS